VSIGAIRAFKGGTNWWAARYAREAADRSLFSPCAAPEDSLFTVAITYPNCAVFLDESGTQRAFLATHSTDERMMWTSEDGRVLCTYGPGSKGSPSTVDLRIGTWRGRQLLSLDGFRAGDFFLGSSGGFVHLTSRSADRDRIEGAPRNVLTALTFYDYGGRVLGRDSTGVALEDRSWRASHSPDGRHFALAGSWVVAEGTGDSLALFDARSGRRLWSRPLGGRPERVRLTPDAKRLVLVAALDDSTHRISVLAGEDGRALVEQEVRGGATEDLVLSCDGKLAFVAGLGYRALVDARGGRILYALTDPTSQLRKASLSNTGEAIAVNVRPEITDRQLEVVLYLSDGRPFWSTPSEASAPGTDVWISPDGRRLFLRALSTLEIYE
jgi:hypothetical protein